MDIVRTLSRILSGACGLAAGLAAIWLPFALIYTVAAEPASEIGPWSLVLAYGFALLMLAVLAIISYALFRVAVVGSMFPLWRRRAVESPQPISSVTPSSSVIRKVFFGQEGLRAGWRFVIFVPLFVGCVTAIRLGLKQIPPLRRLLEQAQSGTMTPNFELVFEPAVIAGLFLVTFVMAKIEKRSFWSYGLPLKGAFGKLFWQGALWGLAMESVEMFAIHALHGFSYGSLALSGLTLVKYALAWALAFVFVGIFEEFSFRGYAQFTLARGIGFWPAAILLSALFGAVHLGNPGEGWIGALSVVAFALFACLTLRRTGSLWFAIGLHAAGDYAETFIYSVPDSGIKATGHLLNSSFHGPRWLTGGTIGPEGSALDFVISLIAFIVFAWLYPANETDDA